MQKVFEWLDNRHFPGDWAIADMIKQYLRGRRRQIVKHEKLTREAEAANLAKECRRCQALLLQKRTVTILAKEDPESLAIEEIHDDEVVSQALDCQWPPARSNKKRHISPAMEESDNNSGLEEDSN